MKRILFFLNTLILLSITSASFGQEFEQMYTAKIVAGNQTIPVCKNTNRLFIPNEIYYQLQSGSKISVYPGFRDNGFRMIRWEGGLDAYVEEEHIDFLSNQIYFTELTPGPHAHLKDQITLPVRLQRKKEVESEISSLLECSYEIVKCNSQNYGLRIQVSSTYGNRLLAKHGGLSIMVDQSLKPGPPLIYFTGAKDLFIDAYELPVEFEEYMYKGVKMLSNFMTGKAIDLDQMEKVFKALGVGELDPIDPSILEPFKNHSELTAFWGTYMDIRDRMGPPARKLNIFLPLQGDPATIKETLDRTGLMIALGINYKPMRSPSTTCLLTYTAEGKEEVQRVETATPPYDSQKLPIKQLIIRFLKENQISAHINEITEIETFQVPGTINYPAYLVRCKGPHFKNSIYHFFVSRYNAMPDYAALLGTDWFVSPPLIISDYAGDVRFEELNNDGMSEVILSATDWANASAWETIMVLGIYDQPGEGYSYYKPEIILDEMAILVSGTGTNEYEIDIKKAGHIHGLPSFEMIKTEKGTSNIIKDQYCIINNRACKREVLTLPFTRFYREEVFYNDINAYWQLGNEKFLTIPRNPIEMQELLGSDFLNRYCYKKEVRFDTWQYLPNSRRMVEVEIYQDANKNSQDAYLYSIKPK